MVAPTRTPEELSVGQVAARSGVSVSALRFCEAEGLIKSRRTPGNQRRYSRDVLHRTAFIRASQGVGIPLRQIKAAFAESRQCFGELEEWAASEEAAGLQHADLEEQVEVRGRELMRQLFQDRLRRGGVSSDSCRKPPGRAGLSRVALAPSRSNAT